MHYGPSTSVETCDSARDSPRPTRRLLCLLTLCPHPPPPTPAGEDKGVIALLLRRARLPTAKCHGHATYLVYVDNNDGAHFRDGGGGGGWAGSDRFHGAVSHGVTPRPRPHGSDSRVSMAGHRSLERGISVNGFKFPESSNLKERTASRLLRSYTLCEGKGFGAGGRGFPCRQCRRNCDRLNERAERRARNLDFRCARRWRRSRIDMPSVGGRGGGQRRRRRRGIPSRQGFPVPLLI